MRFVIIVKQKLNMFKKMVGENAGKTKQRGVSCAGKGLYMKQYFGNQCSVYKILFPPITQTEWKTQIL